MLKNFVILLFWVGFFWLLIVLYIVLNGYTGYPTLQEHEILLLWVPPLVCFLPMFYLSLQSRVFEILSGFIGLKTGKEEENLNETSMEAKDSKSFSGDATTLFIAAQKGLPEMLKALLISTKVDINATTKNGLTALILAIHEGRIEIVKALLEAKRT